MKDMPAYLVSKILRRRSFKYPRHADTQRYKS